MGRDRHTVDRTQTHVQAESPEVRHVRMHPVTMRFDDEEFEARFKQSYARDSRRVIQVAAALAILQYASFFILDLIAVPRGHRELLIIRIGIVSYLLAMVGWTFTKAYLRYWQQLVTIAVIVPGFGLTFMLRVAPVPADYVHTGTMLVLIYILTFVRLRFIYGTLASLAIVCVYEVGAVAWTDLSSQQLVYNNFFLLSALVVGVTTCYVIERSARRNFIQARLIEALYFDRYDQIAAVGSGGQGEVVRALDRRHNRHVALKIRPALDRSRRAELLSEARILLSLQPHPRLPLVRDDFFVDDRYVIVMDWIDGTDLRTSLTNRGDPGLPLDDVLAYLTDVAEALDLLHSHDPPIVHGDVKPANCVLTTEGRVVLVDFGIASGGEGASLGSGTRGFVAPEVILGGRPTPAADVFGFAATAVALLTGRAPDGTSPAFGDMPRLVDALRVGLSVDPSRRPGTTSELLERLRAGVMAG